MTGNIASDNDDLWLEDAIQQELDQLDDNCLLSDDNDELHSPANHVSSVNTKVLDYWLLLVFHSIFCEVDLKEKLILTRLLFVACY